MQHIKVVAVGKLKERFWVDACAEYLKRLRPYVALDMAEIADVDPARAGGEQAAKNAEGEAILRAIPDSAHVILLDVRGKHYSSEKIAAHLDNLGIEGRNDIVFVIGGSCGVSEVVYSRANIKMSFGDITLPHNLARVVLLEQIYRAQKINRGEPYHK
jgi:23S rRNA (pseudouridine1915-N3)-methyltransferase